VYRTVLLVRSTRFGAPPPARVRQREQRGPAVGRAQRAPAGSARFPARRLVTTAYPASVRDQAAEPVREVRGRLPERSAPGRGRCRATTTGRGGRPRGSESKPTRRSGRPAQGGAGRRCADLVEDADVLELGTTAAEPDAGVVADVDAARKPRPVRPAGNPAGGPERGAGVRERLARVRAPVVVQYGDGGARGAGRPVGDGGRGGGFGFNDTGLSIPSWVAKKGAETALTEEAGALTDVSVRAPVVRRRTGPPHSSWLTVRVATLTVRVRALPETVSDRALTHRYSGVAACATTRQAIAAVL
jgi:hypothetical protein